MKTFALLLLTLSAACSDGETTSPTRANSDVQRLAGELRSRSAPTDRVADGAEILDDSQEAGLSMQLERLEQTTGHQMIVVTVPTLGGRDMAALARELGNTWGIGRAQQNDGVVLLVAPKERKVRIAIGDGLEKILSDASCQEIIDRQMLPYFRQKDLPGGIASGVKALASQLQ